MKCEICGKEIEKSMFYDCIICSSECHHKLYWLEKCKQQAEDPYHWTIIDGFSYCFDKKRPIKDSRTDWLGCSGRHFKIRYDNGDTYETNDLWEQGKIPDEFRDRLKDNAEFI